MSLNESINKTPRRILYLYKVAYKQYLRDDFGRSQKSFQNLIQELHQTKNQNEVIDEFIASSLTAIAIIIAKLGNWEESKNELVRLHKDYPKHKKILDFYDEIVKGKVWDIDGLNISGFDKFGLHYKTRQKYDPNGFDINGFNIKGYDRYGYNREGFGKDGYNHIGFNKDGFNKNSIHFVTGKNFDELGFDFNGFDKAGFNKLGFNKKGFDKYGFNSEGYNKLGFDKNGFNKKRIHIATGTNFNELGFDFNGFDNAGFNKLGFNTKGIDKSGYNKLGFNVKGFDKNGFNSEGYNKMGFDREGYNKKGFNKEKIHKYTKTKYDAFGKTFDNKDKVKNKSILDKEYEENSRDL